MKFSERSFWRKGWDSNPRYPCRHAGFQDRCLKPLGHPSVLECCHLAGTCYRGKRQLKLEGLKLEAPEAEGSVGLAEREGQQARAQQHEARRGQGEETVTDIIVVAHDEPHVHDAGPN